MAEHSLTFDAVSEAQPGPAWAARWQLSWPAYRAWFVARGGTDGPTRAEAETMMMRHMPELVPIYRRLALLAGNDDLACRFLAGWCPPRYLGGCSIAAITGEDGARLIRNYDLSPDLNEGFLLHSSWTGEPVMGMVEFLWGLSDGINSHGLAVALAYGGRPDVAEGFGITLILRYVLETCKTVPDAIATLERIPSHMAYNIALADASGATASVELAPGGGLTRRRRPIATNHQGAEQPFAQTDRTESRVRHAHLGRLLSRPRAAHAISRAFLEAPLYRRDYGRGFGTLFTAEYHPASGGLELHWPEQSWKQTLSAFEPGQRTIRYDGTRDQSFSSTVEFDLAAFAQSLRPMFSDEAGKSFEHWHGAAQHGDVDWVAFGRLFVPAPGHQPCAPRPLSQTAGLGQDPPR